MNSEIEKIRKRHVNVYRFSDGSITTTAGYDAHKDRGALLAFIDSQQKALNASQLLGQAAASLTRQYTEAELRAEFERQYNIASGNSQAQIPYRDAFGNWLECARFLGAVKDET